MSSITTDCMTTWCWAWSEDEASVVDCRPKVGLIEDGMIREVEFKDKANWLIPREEQKSIAHLLRSAFCSIYIHAQIVLPGDRANAVDGATEASSKTVASLSVDTIPCDGKASRLSGTELALPTDTLGMHRSIGNIPSLIRWRLLID